MKFKYKQLIWGLILDGIGVLSYAVPVLGESIDFIWAPLSAYIMMRMYPGREGKLGGILTFFEEILPGTDIVPSFTLLWFYKYVFGPKEEKTQTIQQIK